MNNNDLVSLSLGVNCKRRNRRKERGDNIREENKKVMWIKGIREREMERKS